MNGHIHGAKIQKKPKQKQKKGRALNTTNLAKAPHAYSRQHGVDVKKKVALLGTMGLLQLIRVQSMGASPCCCNMALHCEKCLHPKNPLYADNGDGCGAVNT